MLLNSKYLVLEYISRGQFGQIIKVEHNANYYAIKIGAKDIIQHETEIYKQLKGVPAISKVYDIFEYNNHYCLVLDYYIKTLQTVKEESYVNSTVYLMHILNYVKELIVIIKDVHNKNIIHRDIKPSNICLNNTNKVVLIDFGISKIYKNGAIHNSETKTTSLLGSLNFSSLNVINCIEPSRRDDIESIIYVLLYMLLPNTSYHDYDMLDVIQKKDVLISVTFIKNSFPNELECNTFIKLFTYIRRLKYNQQPKYDYIITLLCDLIK
jgi:serine/threonine protein kinase